MFTIDTKHTNKLVNNGDIHEVQKSIYPKINPTVTCILLGVIVWSFTEATTKHKKSGPIIWIWFAQ